MASIALDSAKFASVQGNRTTAVATPFVRLRQPAQLTPVIKGAQKRHAQVLFLAIRHMGAAARDGSAKCHMQLLSGAM